jgi:hypothetical protein
MDPEQIKLDHLHHHHHHHHPFKGYVFELFGPHDVHLFLGRPPPLLHLRLYSKAIFGISDPSVLSNLSPRFLYI